MSIVVRGSWRCTCKRDAADHRVSHLLVREDPRQEGERRPLGAVHEPLHPAIEPVECEAGLELCDGHQPRSSSIRVRTSASTRATARAERARDQRACPGCGRGGSRRGRRAGAPARGGAGRPCRQSTSGGTRSSIRSSASDERPSGPSSSRRPPMAQGSRSEVSKIVEIVVVIVGGVVHGAERGTAWPRSLPDEWNREARSARAEFVRHRLP